MPQQAGSWLQVCEVAWAGGQFQGDPVTGPGMGAAVDMATESCDDCWIELASSRSESEQKGRHME